MIKISNYIGYTLGKCKNQQPVQNLEFYSLNKDNRFCVPGIYFLFYRGELIYIGYTESKDDLFSTRIIRQLATITLRGNTMQFSNDAKEELINNRVFDRCFNKKLDVDNRDFQTSVNRVKFAASHWDEFKKFDNETLSNFELKWFPKPDLQGKKTLSELCNELKKKYKPRCNNEYSIPGITIQ